MLYAYMLLELVNTRVAGEKSGALVAIGLAAVVAPCVSMVCSEMAVPVCDATEGAATAGPAAEIASFGGRTFGNFSGI